MPTAIGRILKRWPPLYQAARRLLHALSPLRFQEMIVGTRAREQEWARRHTTGGDDWGILSREDWVRSYWESRHHPHRRMLVDTIGEYCSASVLEVGSNCGPNLYLLAERFPEARIEGLDVNAEAVARGNEWMRESGMSNVTLDVGTADDLSRYEDNSIDVVFTDAVLMYVGPDKIGKAISEFLRVASKAVVLLEWQDDERHRKSSGLGRRYQGNWIRDYKALTSLFTDGSRTRFTRLSPDVWLSEEWIKVGWLIEVVLDDTRLEQTGP